MPMNWCNCSMPSATNRFGDRPGGLGVGVDEVEGVVGLLGEKVLGEDERGDGGGGFQYVTTGWHSGSLVMAQEEERFQTEAVRYGVADDARRPSSPLGTTAQITPPNSPLGSLASITVFGKVCRSISS